MGGGRTGRSLKYRRNGNHADVKSITSVASFVATPVIPAAWHAAGMSCLAASIFGRAAGFTPDKSGFAPRPRHPGAGREGPSPRFSLCGLAADSGGAASRLTPRSGAQAGPPMVNGLVRGRRQVGRSFAVAGAVAPPFLSANR